MGSNFKVNMKEVASSRENNLDVLRYIAAILVIISHSFPLAYGSKYADPLSVWTDGRLTFGSFAVGFFFVTGGFLITKSCERNGSFKGFFTARIKRIFPQLFFVTFILTFIIGAALTSASLIEYYTSAKTYKYLLNSVLILQHNLLGVFENNPYPDVVNGPLWTLPVEFFCYIMCFVSVKIGFVKQKIYKWTLPLLAIAAVLLYVMFYENSFIISVIRPVLLFYIGMGIYVYREKINFSYISTIISVLMFCIALIFKLDGVAMFVFFPVFVFGMSYATKRKFTSFTKYGEFSYGIYLWGWPVQQVICELWGSGITWYENAAISIVIASILGVLNYYIVDKKIMM
jgi:peptidoglycan/LPS O-acetylase OafA/YrhL